MPWSGPFILMLVGIQGHASRGPLASGPKFSIVIFVMIDH